MTQKAETHGVILAGGGAQRMGGVDKGAVLLAGKRLFDHVYDRLAPQVDRLFVSGAHDYGADLVSVPDRADGPDGPAAGLFATMQWMRVHAPDAVGFLTAPVDAPFLPNDLAARLKTEKGSAIVRCGDDLHPTFAFWNVSDLDAYFKSHDGSAPALHKIAKSIGAREVAFKSASAFANINTLEDLKTAEAQWAKND